MDFSGTTLSYGQVPDPALTTQQQRNWNSVDATNWLHNGPHANGAQRQQQLPVAVHYVFPSPNYYSREELSLQPAGGHLDGENGYHHQLSMMTQPQVQDDFLYSQPRPRMHDEYLYTQPQIEGGFLYTQPQFEDNYIYTQLSVQESYLYTQPPPTQGYLPNTQPPAMEHHYAQEISRDGHPPNSVEQFNMSHSSQSVEGSRTSTPIAPIEAEVMDSQADSNLVEEDQVSAPKAPVIIDLTGDDDDDDPEAAVSSATLPALPIPPAPKEPNAWTTMAKALAKKELKWLSGTHPLRSPKPPRPYGMEADDEPYVQTFHFSKI